MEINDRPNISQVYTYNQRRNRLLVLFQRDCANMIHEVLYGYDSKLPVVYVSELVVHCPATYSQAIEICQWVAKEGTKLKVELKRIDLEEQGLD